MECQWQEMDSGPKLVCKNPGQGGAPSDDGMEANINNNIKNNFEVDSNLSNNSHVKEDFDGLEGLSSINNNNNNKNSSGSDIYSNQENNKNGNGQDSIGDPSPPPPPQDVAPSEENTIQVEWDSDDELDVSALVFDSLLMFVDAAW